MQDYNSPYDSLLSKVNSKSLYKRRLEFLTYVVQELVFLPAIQAISEICPLSGCSLYPIVHAVIMFCLYRLRKVLLMVFTPFRTWLQNSLPDSFSTSDFSDFKRQTLQYDFLIV